ncbi:MAG TPA: HAD-IA family hydrolase [Burkholderiaceae bacterium]|nr:HAD-IA family hydrolase [Burkholderiaceae bacterium]
MLSRFDLIVFDWDGTLMDSTAAIARSIQSAAADLRLPVPSLAQARHVIGMGLADALAYAVPGLRPEQAQAFAARYRHHYAGYETQLVLYEGARELLDAISQAQVPLAVATGKSAAGLARVLSATDLAPYFLATRCADQTHPKPHPAMLNELMAELGSTPERTLMIGDTTHDIQMAQAAGVAVVALTQGAHHEAQLKALQPDALFDSLSQVLRWLIPV